MEKTSENAYARYLTARKYANQHNLVWGDRTKNGISLKIGMGQVLPSVAELADKISTRVTYDGCGRCNGPVTRYHFIGDIPHFKTGMSGGYKKGENAS
jgi:hypothetical protein